MNNFGIEVVKRFFGRFLFLFLFVVLTFLCWTSFETIYIKTSFNKFKSNRCGIQRYSLKTNSSLNVRCFPAILLNVITDGAVLTANIIDTVTNCLQATAETKYREKKNFLFWKHSWQKCLLSCINSIKLKLIFRNLMNWDFDLSFRKKGSFQ